MLLLILKSSACLAVFMLFYKLLLEKESIHTFKRFYLLGALILAILIPLITFTTYIEATPIDIPSNAFEMTTPPYVPEHMFMEPKNYWPTILWSIYEIGVLVFTIRFGMNLTNIIKRIKQNPKFKNQSLFHVLLTDLVPPHTFLNYIFFNKEKYEAQAIPKEVLIHEETHAKEKHALDILFIEILQIIFWFNPLLYLIKKDIKLNHEFLADQAVIKYGIELKNYQKTLLAFSSNANEPQLANAINYISIKKRFTLMKTHTSKHAIWLRSLILLPLLAMLIFSFSSTNEVVKSDFSETENTNHTARSIEIEVLENETYKVDDIHTTKETFKSVINQLHQDITPEIRNQIINVHVNDGKAVSNEDVWFIYNALIDYGFHRIVTYNQEIIREKGNIPYATTNSNKVDEQKGASKEQIAEYNKLAKFYNSQKGNDYTIKLSDMKRIKYLYDLMTKVQRKTAEPFPNFPPPPPPVRESESRSAKEKTNADKPYSYKYKNENGKTITVKVLEKDNSVPPPPPIPQDATPEQIAKYKKVQEEYMAKYSVSKGKVSNIPPPPPPVPADATPEQKEKYKKVHEEYYKKYKVENGKVSERIPPPPPPPLDMEKLAKENALFYYAGNKVSPDEALKIYNADKDLNIQVQDYGSKQPIVRMSKEPIRLKKKK